ncbi:MAG: hypothetical protein M3436_12050 [Pseudomonadota bacterium]|nr:hypothetical protein [Pseudomonadota bacterium]
MKIIAAIEDPTVIAKILTHLGLPDHQEHRRGTSLPVGSGARALSAHAASSVSTTRTISGM